ncbi:MAG: UxaA family hydrolase [Paracoccaceae bacterium]
MDIAIDDHVHVQNCALPECNSIWTVIRGGLPTYSDRTTFPGYERSDGRVGTRNYFGGIASANCSTTVCHDIAAEVNRALLPLHPGIDGFVPIVHD